MQAVTFREGNISLPCRHLCLDGICHVTSRKLAQNVLLGKKKNFHTVVIGGFVALTGPFQLKWWLWFLYRPKMVLLVIETPKNVGFGYVGHMPHKFRNQYLIFTHDLLVLVDRKTSFLVDYMEKSIQIYLHLSWESKGTPPIPPPKDISYIFLVALGEA